MWYWFKEYTAEIVVVLVVVLGVAGIFAIVAADAARPVTSERDDGQGIRVSASGGGGTVTVIELPEHNARCAVLIGTKKGALDCDWR